MANEFSDVVGEILGIDPSGETKLIKTDANGNLFVNIKKSTKGSVTTAINNVAITTTSAEIDCSGFNALLIEITPVGGTWTITAQGCLTTGGTFMDLYDGATQFTSGAISTNRLIYFKGLSDFIKIVATKGTGTSCTIKVQPINI